MALESIFVHKYQRKIMKINKYKNDKVHCIFSYLHILIGSLLLFSQPSTLNTNTINQQGFLRTLFPSRLRGLDLFSSNLSIVFLNFIDVSLIEHSADKILLVSLWSRSMSSSRNPPRVSHLSANSGITKMRSSTLEGLLLFRCLGKRIPIWWQHLLKLDLSSSLNQSFFLMSLKGIMQASNILSNPSLISEQSLNTSVNNLKSVSENVSQAVNDHSFPQAFSGIEHPQFF